MLAGELITTDKVEYEMDLDWKHVVVCALIFFAFVFLVHSCNTSLIEIEKTRANKTHDINLGFGKNRN